MTIAQIECFLEIVRMGNITRAAESLFITQQAASKHVQAIEKELGYPVFERKRKGIELTEEGKILYAEWVKVYELYRISIDKAHDFRVGKDKTIRIGMADMGNCSENILYAFNEYEKKYRDLTILFQMMNPREMYYALESKELDLAICYESELKDISSFRCLPLHENKLNICAFMTKNHPLAQKEISMKDFVNEPIGILSTGYSLDFEAKMHEFFGYYGLKYQGQFQTFDSRRSLEIALIAGRCVTIVYETMFLDTEQKLVSKQLDMGDLSSRMAMFWNNDEITIKARSLGAILQEQFKREH